MMYVFTAGENVMVLYGPRRSPMRLSDLERWLCRHGWQPEPMKRGSHRAWTHPLYPDQRLTYSDPHDGARSSGELRPDVILAIYQKLIAMRPAATGDDGETRSQDAQSA